jgi:hypothetical protein
MLKGPGTFRRFGTFAPLLVSLSFNIYKRQHTPGMLSPGFFISRFRLIQICIVQDFVCL